VLSSVRWIHQLTFAKYEQDRVDTVRSTLIENYGSPSRDGAERAVELAGDDFAGSFGNGSTSGIFQAQPAERTNAVNEKKYQVKNKETRNRLAGVRSRVQEAQGVVPAKKQNKTSDLDLWAEISAR
jgi:hypothetical protein